MHPKTTGRPTRQICPGLMDTLVKGLVLELRGTRPYATASEVQARIKADLQVLSVHLIGSRIEQDLHFLQLSLLKIAVGALRGFCDIYPEGFVPPDADHVPHKPDTAKGTQTELPS